MPKCLSNSGHLKYICAIWDHLYIDFYNIQTQYVVSAMRWMMISLVSTFAWTFTIKTSAMYAQKNHPPLM